MRPVPWIVVLVLFVCVCVIGVFMLRSSDRSSRAARQAQLTANTNTRLLAQVADLTAATQAQVTANAELALKVAADEAATHKSAEAGCKIQARGLRAQRYLTGVLDAFHILLTIPPPAGSQQNVPPNLLRLELRAVKMANQNLSSYLKIEKQQPPSRSC